MRPAVFIGAGQGRVLEHARAMGWGRLYSRYVPGAGEPGPFILDNGAFAAWRRGEPFPDVEFLNRVQRCHAKGLTPAFVVLPDVVADAGRTFHLSDCWHGVLPEHWPKYFALQDGMEAWQVANFCKRRQLAGVFLGGTAWFKDTRAAIWRSFARDHGLKFHYARAGTPRKFEHAINIGADSLDSTRLSRSWRDFTAARKLWQGETHPRLFADVASLT